MNTSREATKARDQSQSVGARRVRRFTARLVLGVRESQKCWTLNAKAVSAPFPASHRTPRRSRVHEARLKCPQGFGVR